MRLLRHASGFWIHSGRQAIQDAEVICEVWASDCYQVGRFSTPARVVDVGAHIGSFAVKVHTLFPQAQIVCVEACPENISCLEANVGEFAQIIQAACTYESAELMLLNSVLASGTATGGSVVLPADNRALGPHVADGEIGTYGHLYWKDMRPLRKVTLEELLPIDVLKLDCEGSEFSILENTTSLKEIKEIVGEYHGRQRWHDLVRDRFSGWHYEEHHAAGDLGLFRLVRP